MSIEEILPQYTDEYLRRLRREKANKPITRAELEAFYYRLDEMQGQIDELKFAAKAKD